MAAPPDNYVKFVRVFSDDESGAVQWPNEFLKKAGIGGLIVRLASNKQLHGTGKYGHQDPGAFNDHSVPAHIQQAWDLGLFCFLEFDLHLAWDDMFAGSDYETQDKSYVPLMHQLKNQLPGKNFHALIINVIDHGDTGTNMAVKLSQFLAMVDAWNQGRIKVYIRTSEEVWNKDSQAIANVIMNRSTNEEPQPYVLNNHTRKFPAVNFDAPPAYFDAPVYEISISGHKYKAFCLWFYAETGIVQWFCGWGTMPRAIQVLGCKPHNYDDGSVVEPPGGGVVVPPPEDDNPVVIPFTPEDVADAVSNEMKHAFDTMYMSQAEIITTLRRIEGQNKAILAQGNINAIDIRKIWDRVKQSFIGRLAAWKE
jgi:hypothetical protein